MQNSISYLRSSSHNYNSENYVGYWESMLATVWRKEMPSNWYEDDLYVALSFLPYRKSIMLVVDTYHPYLRVVRNEIIRLFGTPFNSRHRGHLSYLGREIIIISKVHEPSQTLGYRGDVFRLDPETTLMRQRRIP